MQSVRRPTQSDGKDPGKHFILEMNSVAKHVLTSFLVTSQLWLHQTAHTLDQGWSRLNRRTRTWQELPPTRLRFSTESMRRKLGANQLSSFPIGCNGPRLCPHVFSTEVRSLGVLWCSYFMNIIHVVFHVFFFSRFVLLLSWFLSDHHCHFLGSSFPHNNIMTWKAAPWAYAGEPAVWLRVTTEEMDYTWLFM